MNGPRPTNRKEAAKSRSDCRGEAFPNHELVDQLCDEYERQRRAGANPSLDRLLSEVDDANRFALLREVIAVEMELCGNVDLHHYLQRYPEYAGELRREFGSAETSQSITASFHLDHTADSSLSEASSRRSAADTRTDEVDHGPPARFGRYEVIRLVGKGAFGHVYLARDSELDRSVALKVPRREMFTTMKAQDAFLDEARKAAQLDHPGIVRVFDVQRNDQELYIVQQFVEGEELGVYHAASNLTYPEIAAILAAIADAAAYAHQRGIVHRDLKPQNILITQDQTPLIADFGLAIHEEEQVARRGEVSGSPAYMAPEQVEGRADHLDGRTDIWALGIIFYELLTGRRPFGGRTQSEVFDQIRHRDVRPPRQIKAEVPAALQEIILTCLAKPMTGRYATATDLAEALRKWLREYHDSQSGRASMLGNGTLATALGSTLFLAVIGGFLLASTHIRDDRSRDAFPRRPTSPPADASQPETSQASAIEADLTLSIVRDGRIIPIDDPRSRPLRPGDGVQVSATLNRPAYVYLIWIDESGSAQPFYPGTPDAWHEFAASGELVTSLVLPGVGGGYHVEGEGGMQTILLLASATPLTEPQALREAFQDLPHQPAQDYRSLVFWDMGAVSSRRDRGPDFFNVVTANDPVRETLQVLQSRLEELFSSEMLPVVRAVSVAVDAD